MENLLRKKKISLKLFVAVVLCVSTPAWAQVTVQFPQTTTTYQSSTFGQPPGTGMGAPPAASQPPSLGAPTFDPFSANPATPPPAFSSPTYGAPPVTGSTMPSTTGAAPPGAVAPYSGAPGAAGPPPPYGTPYSQPYGGYPGAVPGNSPPSLYPGGWNTNNWLMPATRFLTPRVRYTYVDGGNAANDLGINDFDCSVVAAFPNFLYSTQPLLVAPSFSLHLWQGPRAPNGDLPANAYSAFLDFGWSTDPAKQLGGEVGVRLGVFTDFNTFNTNSGRIMGHGLFRLQTTPTTTVRGGVYYIDRNDLKLLPALGVLWTPNTMTRFDIFFPQPKLSQQLTTMGNHDVWWYVSGEYGGGAWTVQRDAGFSDRIDINDIRLILGIEWGQSALLQQGRRTGFFEAGWVTNREFVSVVEATTYKLSDSFMLRAGWNY